MNKIYIGVDNGVSGSWSILQPGKPAEFFKVPVKKCLNYTKEKAWINRIDVVELEALLLANLPEDKSNCLVVMERAMVNPKRWKASMSAIRALEATLIVLEKLQLPYIYIDSKEWQREMLPHNVSGDELKPASKQVAERLFPSLKFKSDGDGILIAEWARRKQL